MNKHLLRKSTMCHFYVWSWGWKWDKSERSSWPKMVPHSSCMRRVESFLHNRYAWWQGSAQSGKFRWFFFLKSSSTAASCHFSWFLSGKKGRIVWEKAKERHPPSKVTGHQGHRCQDLVKGQQSCYCCVKRALQPMNDKELQRRTWNNMFL